MGGTKISEITEISQLFVKGDAMLLSLVDAHGQKIDLELSNELSRELAHIMIDGLRQQRSPEFRPEPGSILAPSRLEEPSLEFAQSELGMDPKIVFQAKSSNGPLLNYRIARPNFREWIDAAERMLVRNNLSERSSS